MKKEMNVTANINWNEWMENVLASLPSTASLGEADIIKKHLEDALNEIRGM